MKTIGCRWISWIEAVLLAAMAPLFVFPAVDRLWPFLVFPALWIARFWVEKWKRPGEISGCGADAAAGTPIDAAMLLLVVQLFHSSAVSGNWEAMLPKILGIVYGILVFYALVRVLRTERLAGVGLGGFLAGGAALVGFGLTGMFVSKEPHFRKILGSLWDRIPQKNWEFAGAEAGLNPNAVAGVMLLFVPLCLVLAAGWIKARRRDEAGTETNPEKTKALTEGMLFQTAGVLTPVFCGLLSIFYLFVLFLTQAVAAWVALAASLWLVLPSGKSRAIGAVPTALFIAAVLVFLPEADADASNRRDTAYWMHKIETRHLRWAVGIDAVREEPVTGVGVNMLRQRPELGYESSHAHNHMLHTAAEMGIPGLIAYLAVLGGGLWMCRSVWRRAGPVWMRAAARGLGAGQAAHFIFGWGDSIPLGAKPGIFFWVSLALIAALYNLTLRDRTAGPDPARVSRPESSNSTSCLSSDSEKPAPTSTHFSSGFIKQPLFLKCALKVFPIQRLEPTYLEVSAGEKSDHRSLKKVNRRLDLRGRKSSRFLAIFTVVVLVFLTLFPRTASARSSMQRRVLGPRVQTAVVSESPGQSGGIRASRMISGNPNATWISRQSDAPPFVFVFALRTDSWIELLRFHNSGREDKLPGAGAREVEVEFSTAGPDSGFYRAGFFSLEKGSAPQDFQIPRSRARWVRLTIRSNHGHTQFTELGEFEAWGQYDFHAGLLASYFVWIVGAALVLGAFGWHEHQACREKRPLKNVLRRRSFLRPAFLGAGLFGMGVTALAHGPMLAVVAVGVALAAGIGFMKTFRHGSETRS